MRFKKCLKIPNGSSEAVNLRTDNIITKTRTKWQTKIYKTLHRKLKTRNRRCINKCFAYCPINEIYSMLKEVECRWTHSKHIIFAKDNPKIYYGQMSSDEVQRFWPHINLHFPCHSVVGILYFRPPKAKTMWMWIKSPCMHI